MLDLEPNLAINKLRLDLPPEGMVSAGERVLPLGQLIGLLEQARKYYLIASTSGSFDLVHPGHVRYIGDLVRVAGFRARSLEKPPFVAIGINSDRSTQSNRENRACGRPVFPELMRAEVVAGFKGVNVVFIFDDDLELTQLRPDIFQVFTLSDHAPETRPEILLMRQRGTEIVTVHDNDRPTSTSAILQKIHTLNIY